MDASATLDDSMTLLEKLAKIDQMINDAMDKQQQESGGNRVAAPVDPAELTMCEGCQ